MRKLRMKGSFAAKTARQGGKKWPFWAPFWSFCDNHWMDFNETLTKRCVFTCLKLSQSDSECLAWVDTLFTKNLHLELAPKSGLFDHLFGDFAITTGWISMRLWPKDVFLHALSCPNRILYALLGSIRHSRKTAILRKDTILPQNHTCSTRLATSSVWKDVFLHVF